MNHSMKVLSMVLAGIYTIWCKKINYKLMRTTIDDHNDHIRNFTCRYPIPEREIKRNRGDMTAPYRTPALIGCAIAVDREFFFEIGAFDMGMSIWGGENAELSLRASIILFEI